MTIITSIILGVVEGLTEFLPISSTGHLILSSEILKLPNTEFLKSFEIIIQLGAIGAVMALYWRQLLINWAVMKRVAAAFIPTAIIGLLLYKIIKSYLLGNSWVVVGSLFIGGIVLILFELWLTRKDSQTFGAEDTKLENLEKMSYKEAVTIGLCQSLAVIPGVSRSAATIVGGLALNMTREAIVEFSFLLAVPTMLAATGLDLIKSSPDFTVNEFGLLLIGFMVSFLVALLAIKTFLAYIRNNNFIAFGIYRIVIAIVFALVFLI
ncbi:MAG: undecaprenyl-diphosphatase UppP [Candidatus Paceibacterota bacterium]|jgi:undecaprenyl-diphosphatase